MFRTLCHSFYTDKVFLPCFIFGIIPHYYFEKSIYHNGFITKYYPPNVLSNVLLKKHWETTYFSHELQGYGFSPVCILKCLFKKYPVWNPLHSNYSMISCWSGFLNVYWNEQFVRILLDICYNYMASRLYEFTDVFSNCILRKS